MRNTLSSIWTWAAAVFLIVVWYPMLAVVRLFDRDPIHYRTGRFFRRLGASLSYLNPFWDIEVQGDLPDEPRAGFIVVCNHLSHADVPIVSRLPWEMKWVAKKELFDLPVAGHMMKMADDIAVNRKSRRSRAEVLIATRNVLEHGCPVMFFPEGTRSRDGKVHRFNIGPFALAIREQVPVLPLAIDGTQDALPKHSWKFKEPDAPMRLKVFPMVETTGLTADDAEALKDRVRDQIIDQLAAWRNVPADEVDAFAARKESVKPPAEVD